MYIEPEGIEAEAYFYDETKDRYYVKIRFVDLGLYINSFSVQPSKFDDQPYWVQPPKHRQGIRWVATVDIEKKESNLWPIIQQKALEAVELYNYTHGIKKSKQDEVVEVDVTKPITLDDFPDH